MRWIRVVVSASDRPVGTTGRGTPLDRSPPPPPPGLASSASRRVDRDVLRAFRPDTNGRRKRRRAKEGAKTTLRASFLTDEPKAARGDAVEDAASDAMTAGAAEEPGRRHRRGSDDRHHPRASAASLLLPMTARRPRATTPLTSG